MAPPGGGEDGSTAEDAKNDEVFEQTQQQQQLGAPGNVADRPILERKDTLSPRPGRNTKNEPLF